MAARVRDRAKEQLGIDDGRRLLPPLHPWDKRFGEPGFPGVGLTAYLIVLALVGGGILALTSGEGGWDAVILVALPVVLVAVGLAVAAVLSPRHPIRPPVAQRVPRPSASAGDEPEGLLQRWDRSNQLLMEDAAQVSDEQYRSSSGYQRFRIQVAVAIGGLVICVVVATVASIVRS